MFFLLSTCMVGFTSCSDDDDEDGEVGSGIVGTWQSVKVDSWENNDGEYSEYKGPYDRCTIIFTADGKITQNDDGEKDSGTYKLIGDKITVTYEEEGEVETDEIKVLLLNGDKLILESENNEVYDGKVYKDYLKMELKRVK